MLASTKASLLKSQALASNLQDKNRALEEKLLSLEQDTRDRLEAEAEVAKALREQVEFKDQIIRNFNSNGKSSQRRCSEAQTGGDLLTEKELDLLVEVGDLTKKLKRALKQKDYNQNKISKFIYFFFTLQNKGIPVNDIYEQDGVKAIKTDRF